MWSRVKALLSHTVCPLNRKNNTARRTETNEHVTNVSSAYADSCLAVELYDMTMDEHQQNPPSLEEQKQFYVDEWAEIPTTGTTGRARVTES